LGTKQHIPRVYINQPILIGDSVQLPQEKAHHLTRVLRASEGASITLFNGHGGEYEGVLAPAKKGEAMVYVKTHVDVDRESPLKVDLLMGLCKRDAMSAALRRATELGVTSITPLITDFSDVSPRQLPSLRAKWLATIESAAEQSGRTRLPELLEAQPFAEILSAIRDSNAQAFIAHPLGERLAATRSQHENYVLAIGPEGGFSDAEVDKACDAGFKTLALGPRILRAETAPAAALAILQHHAGDL